MSEEHRAAAFEQLENRSGSGKAPLKEQTVMIGDSLSSDIRGGSNFGIDTCWYNPSGEALRADLAGLAPPTHVVATYGEIEQLVI